MAIPIPRDPAIDLSDVPRHWVAENPVATAISNGINLLFPHGERFFVRSVHHYLDQLDDPELKAQVKGVLQAGGPPRPRARRAQRRAAHAGLRDRHVPRALREDHALDRGPHARQAQPGGRPPRPSTSPRSSRTARSTTASSTRCTRRCRSCSRGTPPRRSSTRRSRSTCSTRSTRRTRCASPGWSTPP